MIHLTTLCTSISSIIRERFGLHVSAERRKLALLQADKALAHWSSMLPPHLCMTSDVENSPDCWAAKLHLVYHNLLILLHRPHPRADDYGPHDAEICIAAAGVIVATMEDLRQKDRLKYLWVSSVNAMFTAMIQVRVELCFSNALLAMNALGRFNSAATSLKVLGEYWIIAETLTRVFMNSKRLQRDLQDLRHDTKNDQFNDAEKDLEFSGSSTVDATAESANNAVSGNGQAARDSEAAPVTGQNPWASQQLPLRLHYQTAIENTTLEDSGVIANGGPQRSAHDIATTCAPSQLNSLPMQDTAAIAPDSAQMHTLMLDQSPTTPHVPHLPTHHDYINPSCSPTDWHQLFNFDGPGNNAPNGTTHIFPADLLPMEHSSQFENEWRDLYLQESGMPEITDYLGQEAGWMLG